MNLYLDDSPTPLTDAVMPQLYLRVESFEGYLDVGVLKGAVRFTTNWARPDNPRPFPAFQGVWGRNITPTGRRGLRRAEGRDSPSAGPI